MFIKPYSVLAQCHEQSADDEPTLSGVVEHMRAASDRYLEQADLVPGDDDTHCGVVI